MNQITICIITNRINGKSFVFKSKDLENRWDRFKKQLDNHSFYNKNLQEDWNNFGSSAFLFEKKAVANEKNIDKVFVKIIKSLDKTYNELDYNSFLDKPLDSTIKKLKNDLEEKISGSNFKVLTNKSKLEESDILNFKQELVHQIESGEINYNNFDDEFYNLLDDYSKRKKVDLNNERILSLLTYSNELNNSNLDQIRLNESDIKSIKSEIQKLINDGELNSKNEILTKFRSLSNEKYEKNNYKNKCHDLLNSIINSDYFKNMLKSNKLSNTDGINIKNTVVHLIDNDEIALEEIEKKVNDLLIEKSLEKKGHHDNIKEELKDNAFKIIGNEQNININFKNRLKDVYLHENVAYAILVKILRSINTGEITSIIELNSSIDNEIKQKEKEDVFERLNNLSSNQLSILLKKNNIRDLSLNKSSKIDKLIFSVSPKVLRNDIRNLGYTLDIKYVENPYVSYCPECGFEVSIEEEDFCTRCGYNLMEPDDDEPEPPIKKSKRTLEFTLTLIAFILTIIGILIALINYNSYYNANIMDALFSAIIGVFSAIIIRNYPKIGAIISIVAGFFIFVTNIPFNIIILLFYIISAVLCFARK